MKTNKNKPLMNESIADGDTLQGTWSPSRAQLGVSVSTVQDLKKRIQKILVALLEETWLPITLRGHMAEEVADLEEILNSQNLSDSSMVAKEVPSISFMLSMYGNTHPNSKLIAQMRMLDQELNSSAHLRIASDQRRAS